MTVRVNGDCFPNGVVGIELARDCEAEETALLAVVIVEIEVFIDSMVEAAEVLVEQALRFSIGRGDKVEDVWVEENVCSEWESGAGGLGEVNGTDKRDENRLLCDKIPSDEIVLIEDEEKECIRTCPTVSGRGLMADRALSFGSSIIARGLSGSGICGLGFEGSLGDVCAARLSTSGVAHPISKASRVSVESAVSFVSTRMSLSLVSFISSPYNGPLANIFAYDVDLLFLVVLRGFDRAVSDTTFTKSFLYPDIRAALPEIEALAHRSSTLCEREAITRNKCRKRSYSGDFAIGCM